MSNILKQFKTEINESIIKLLKERKEKIVSIRFGGKYENANTCIYVFSVKTKKHRYIAYHKDNYLKIVTNEQRESLKSFASSILSQSFVEALLFGEGYLKDDFLKAIGRFVVNFCHLELILKLYCGTNMGTEYPINEIVTSELSFKQLTYITSSIIKSKERRKKKIEEFAQIYKELFQLEAVRNQILHSHYAQGEKIGRAHV